MRLSDNLPREKIYNDNLLFFHNLNFLKLGNTYLYILFSNSNQKLLIVNCLLFKNLVLTNFLYILNVDKKWRKI